MSSNLSNPYARSTALIAGAFILGACATGPRFARFQEPSADAPVLLLPGTRELDVSALREETVDYRVLADSGAGSETRAFGMARSEIHATTYRGSPAFLLVTNTSRGPMRFMDSAFVRRDDLAPIREVNEFRGVHRQFDYDGARVQFVGRSADSTFRGEHTYPRPVFGFNEVDILVRTIPLVPGYRAVVPLYSEGSDELEMDTIRVARPRADGPWDVRFSDPVIVSHYGVDPATRAIVSRVITRQDGGPLRLRYEIDPAAKR